MRTLIFLVSVFYVSLSFGQSEFEKRYSKGVCTCIENKHLTKINVDDFIECFQQTLQDDSALVMEQCKRIYGDTLDVHGRHFGNDLMEKLKISMVSQCRPYFVFFDSLRYKSINNLNRDSLKMQLKNLDSVAFLGINNEVYKEKALLFFQIKMYDSSLVNVANVLKTDSSDAQALYLKGWIDEIRENYDEAISLYNKVAVLTNQNNFYIFSEIAKRKKKEYDKKH